MDTTDIIYNCAQKLDCDARRFEPMSRHTSFQIGEEIIPNLCVSTTHLFKNCLCHYLFSSKKLFILSVERHACDL